MTYIEHALGGCLLFWHDPLEFAQINQKTHSDLQIYRLTHIITENNYKDTMTAFEAPREESSESEDSEPNDLVKVKKESEKEPPERAVLSHRADYYPMRFVSIPFCGKEIYLNPFTAFFGFAVLWGLAIWCMVDPDGALETLTAWQADVTDKFTWFYIVANPCFTFFVLWLVIRYGDVKLGKKDEEPEFDDSSYFMMLFSAGVGIGLFFFGVSEPLSHRTSNWFAETGYRAQDEIDQWALMLTMYHWGFAVSNLPSCCGGHERGEIMMG